MTNAAPLKLKAAFGTVKALGPLIDGTVKVPGVEFEHSELSNYVEIWRRMASTLDFDVSLMSVVSYLCAIEYNVPITCLPVSFNPGFHHGELTYNVDSGVKTPKDFEGKKIGTRTWTVTPGTLDRGILTEEFGMDWKKVTWILAEPEHVPQVQPNLPKNVIGGHFEDLFPRLVSGEIAGGMAGSNLNRGVSEKVKPLFPNAKELDKAYYDRTGILQPFALLCVKNSVIEQAPWFLEALYNSLKEAKKLANVEAEPAVKAIIGDADPMPYGREVNRAGFEEAIHLCTKYETITKPMTVDQIFPDLN